MNDDDDDNRLPASKIITMMVQLPRISLRKKVCFTICKWELCHVLCFFGYYHGCRILTFSPDHVRHHGKSFSTHPPINSIPFRSPEGGCSYRNTNIKLTLRKIADLRLLSNVSA